MSQTDQGTADGPGGAADRPAWILTDEDIAEYANERQLIVPFEARSAKYASYEVHASDNVQLLIYHGEETGHVRHPIADGEIVIPAGATVKIDTQESICLPNDIMANIIGLGQLYACGVTLANTYVDPGSNGPVYLAATNLGRRAVRIPVGEPIGRVQFYSLGRPVRTAHPGREHRRNIVLQVVDAPPGQGEGELGEGDSPAARDAADPAALERMRLGQKEMAHRLTLMKLALYAVSGAWLGLLWTVAPTEGNRALELLNGDGIPPPAKLAVALGVPVLLTLLFQDIRQSLVSVLRRIFSRDPADDG